MIVDAHTHIVPERFITARAEIAALDATFGELFSVPWSRLATADELLRSMADANIDRSAVLGYGWTDIDLAREANDYILDAAGRSDGRIIPFCSVNPAWGDDAIEEVERCAGYGARGIGELHPDTQGFDIRDAGLLGPLMDAAKRLDLIVVTHTSEPVGHTYPGKGTVTPEKLETLVQDHPENSFVFAHMGGGMPFYALMPEVMQDLALAWFDTAAMPYLYEPEVYPAALQMMGEGKLLFGSDFPLISQSRAMAHIVDSDLTDRQRMDILGATSVQLLGI